MNVEPLLSKWEIKWLEELSSAIQYGYTAKATTERIGPKLLRITDIQNDAVDWDAVPYCEISAKEIEKYRLGKNDLLFARTGATVGKSYLIAGSIPESVFASYLIRVRLLEAVYPKYVAYFFRSGDYWRQISENQAGIGQPNVNGTKLAQIKIPVPPLNQQGLIVAEIEKQFSRLDEAVANLKRVRANLKRYKAAVLKAAVEGKLTEDWRKQHPRVEPASILISRTPVPPRPNRWNSRSKDIILGHPALAVGNPGLELPSGWTWSPLVDIARMESGHTPSREHPEWWDGEVPWIGIADAREHDGRVIMKTFQHTNKDGLANSAARLLPSGTVCVSRTASVGYVVVLGCSMATSQDFVNWIPTAAVTSEWLRVVFSADREALRRFGKGSVHKTIYFPEWLSVHIGVPPISEQNQIVAEVERRLSVIEELEAAVQSNLTRADRLRQSILSQAFSGRLLGQDTKHIPDILPTFSIVAESQARHERDDRARP